MGHGFGVFMKGGENVGLVEIVGVDDARNARRHDENGESYGERVFGVESPRICKEGIGVRGGAGGSPCRGGGIVRVGGRGTGGRGAERWAGSGVGISPEYRESFVEGLT